MNMLMTLQTRTTMKGKSLTIFHPFQLRIKICTLTVITCCGWHQACCRLNMFQNPIKPKYISFCRKSVHFWSVVHTFMFSWILSRPDPFYTRTSCLRVQNQNKSKAVQLWKVATSPYLTKQDLKLVLLPVYWLFWVVTQT